MSRTAKMVKVLPTAHRQPAITPHNTRCGTCRASRKVSPVPRINAGRLQRETNAPRTIMKEITIGETATVTSLVGASAPASQSAAAKPQNIPSRCSSRCRDRSGRRVVNRSGPTQSFRYSSRYPEQQQSNQENDQRNPELNIPQDRSPPASPWFHAREFVALLHGGDYMSSPAGLAPKQVARVRSSMPLVVRHSYNC